MRPDRIALCCVFLLLSYEPSFAQGWPWWADGLLNDRPSWRFDQPPRREEPQRESPRRPRSTETVQDGGARPVIAPIAPRMVAFPHDFPANSIVIDAGARKLYFVLFENRAYEYPVSVGRDGFNWTGTETVSRKQAWPDWHPPPEMRDRDATLPEKMTGGLRNPLGAMALYLGNSLYRIHGTNDVKSIGQAQSSGCFRMLNPAVLHLASLADVGTTVTVVSSLQVQREISRAPEVPGASPARNHEPVSAPGLTAAIPAETGPVPRAPDYRALRDYTLGRP